MTTPPPAGLAVLAVRAAELARPLDGEQETDTLELLLVTAGAQQVAIPVQDVREVRPPGPVAQVPGSTGALVGVVGGHGEPLAVASLTALLGLPLTLLAAEQWLLVLDHPRAPLGLLADAALDVVRVGQAELSAPTDPGGLTRALLPGGAVVLDTVALLRDPRLSIPVPDQTEESPWPEG